MSSETFCRSNDGSWYLTVACAVAAARLVVSRSRLTDRTAQRGGLKHDRCTEGGRGPLVL
jgi:hypothetical protein